MRAVAKGHTPEVVGRHRSIIRIYATVNVKHTLLCTRSSKVFVLLFFINQYWGIVMYGPGASS